MHDSTNIIFNIIKVLCKKTINDTIIHVHFCALNLGKEAMEFLIYEQWNYI